MYDPVTAPSMADIIQCYYLLFLYFSTLPEIITKHKVCERFYSDLQFDTMFGKEEGMG